MKLFSIKYYFTNRSQMFPIKNGKEITIFHFVCYYFMCFFFEGIKFNRNKKLYFMGVENRLIHELFSIAFF